MKLLRVGQKGNEKPATLDKEGKIRDLSSHVKDLNPEHVNFETISKLQSVDLTSLPELSSSERVGSCVTKPGKFVAIGLNYSDHAAETGAEVPSEPIMFMKATSCIAGPNDNVEIVSGSKKLDWEVELELLLEKKQNIFQKIKLKLIFKLLISDISSFVTRYGPIGP